jgi:hypothetical protein
MKKLIVWPVCLLLGGFLLAQDGNDAKDKKTAAAPAGAPTVQLVLELSDGSRINGTTATDRLQIKAKYATMEFQLSKARMIGFSGTNHAARVDLQNGDQLSGQVVATEIAMKTSSGRVVIALARVSRMLEFPAGTFVNSLGMIFLPVPGTKALFSIWDTRVKDYLAYAGANAGVDGRWKDPGFKQGEDHRVVKVSWNEAKAFCAWLTLKERKEWKIGRDQEYRLPTDQEWSAAVGAGKYPWGDHWPPPNGAGNYAASLHVDEFEYTSPVGSFKPNEYGLYDMGGNVWQWCEDWYDSTQQSRVVRGAAWNLSEPDWLVSSMRYGGLYPTRRSDWTVGFRCVLAPAPPSRLVEK